MNLNINWPAHHEYVNYTSLGKTFVKWQMAGQIIEEFVNENKNKSSGLFCL